MGNVNARRDSVTSRSPGFLQTSFTNRVQAKQTRSSSMANLSTFGSWLLLTYDNKFALCKVGESGWSQGRIEDNQFKQKEVKEDDEEETEEKKPAKPEVKRTVVAGAVSKDGDYVGICDSKKTLSIWTRDGAG